MTKLEQRVRSLRKAYADQRIELNERLEELAAKDLWDIYNDREIHLRYVDSTIDDLDLILNEVEKSRSEAEG